MNDLIYNKNMKRILDRWPQYVDVIEHDITCDNGFCAVEYINEKYIPVVYQNDKAYRLASTHHNEHVLDIWISAINMKTFELNMFMFGLGNGMYVRRLFGEMSNNDMTRIIVYEPSTFIIKECLYYYDMTDIIADNRFELIIPIPFNNRLLDYIIQNINYHNINGVHSSCYINYHHLFNEEYKAYKEQIIRALDMIRANQHMMNVMSQMQYNNTLKNHNSMSDSYSLDSLSVFLPKTLPVIIVSSGPSLINNIKYVKEAKGKSIIVCVDSALGAMNAAGIIPDMYITLDPTKHEANFAFKWLEELPIIASITSPEYVFKEKQKRFVVCPLDTYISEFNEDSRKYFKKWDLRSGGSVACSAFKLFLLLGCNRIILIGQDLAYSGNKAHADTVAYDDDDMSETLLYTNDIYGNKILTSKTLEMYKEWFEEEIKKNKWCKVIDATEGGAYIEGTTISTLREAIDKYCNERYDVFQAFNKCRRLYEGEMNKKYKDYICALPMRMDNIIVTAKKILYNYNKIEQLIKQSKITSEEMNVLLRDNGRMTGEIEDDPAYCYINYLNVDSSKRIENDVNTVDSDINRDILNMCSLGRTHIKGVIESAKKIKSDYRNVFDT